MIDKNLVPDLFPTSRDNLNVNFRRENQFLDWERAGILFDNHLIPSQQGVYMELIVKQVDESRRVFEMEWAMFDDTGYINWIRMNEELQGQGISKELRRMVINGLFSIGCVEIFTIPSSTAGENLAKSQGFIKTETQPEKGEYTVYSITRSSWD